MRALAVLVASFALACSSPKSLAPCDVDVIATGDVAMTSYVTCGAFSNGDVNYTDEAMAAAQACVLNAIKANRPYELVYDAADQKGVVTGDLRVGWTGVVPMGMSTIVSHVYAGQGHDGDMGMLNVSATTCMTVTASDDCTPSVVIPCLTCTPMGTGTAVCRH